MIIYALQCSEGHGFEGWFRDSAAFDAQEADGKLLCPVCDTHAVTKAPMAPALKGAPVERHSAPEEIRKMRRFMTGLRKYVEQNADYVGPKFPEEARKIHYGESDKRGIYGETSDKEAEELAEEGIEFGRLPWVPRDN